MLTETPVQLRQALVIGLGNVGQLTVKGLESLLEERLGDVPVIGLVTIEPDFTMGGSEIVVDRPRTSRWHIRLPMAEGAGDFAASSQHAARASNASPAGAHSSSVGYDPAELRETGRDAIYRWATRLNDTLNEIYNSIRAMDNRTAVLQRPDRTMRMDETGLLEVFTVAALDEPFASGAYLDLAYLMDYVLSLDTGGKFHYQTSGVLYLPTYTTPDRATSMSVREADTYAALKELDYYTSSGAYSFESKSRLKFKLKSPPFKTNCFLIDSTNEQNLTIGDLGPLTMMVADWLYYFLTSPLAGNFRDRGMSFASRTSQGRVTAYSGLGIASRVLPIEAAIEVCGMRLGKEIVQKHLRSSVKGSDDGSVGTAQVFARDRVAKLLQDTILSQPDVAKFKDVPTQNFENITIWEFNQLRDRLKKEFVVNKRNRTLPGISIELRKTLDQKIMTLRQTTLPEEVNGLVDATDASCLDRAQIFLERLRKEMEANEREARDQIASARKREQEADQAIAETRADYKSATEAIRPGSLVFMLVALVPILGVMVYALRVLLEMLPGLELPVLGGRNLDLDPFNIVAALLVVLGNLAVLFMAFRHLWVWPRRSKEAYIGAHRDRLDPALRRVQGEQSGYFYSVVQRVVADELTRLTDLRDRVDLIGRELEQRTKNPPPLVGMLHHPMEKSVLEPTDQDDFYEEMIRPSGEAHRSDLGRFVNRMVSTKDVGKVSTWTQRNVDELVRGIVAFGKREMDPLRRRRSAEGMLIVHLKDPEIPDHERIDVLVEMLSKDPADEQAATFFRLPTLTQAQDQALRDSAQELFNCSSPFLRFAQPRIQGELDQPFTRLLGTYDGTTETRPFNRLVTAFFPEVQRVSTSDPHVLVAMSVRHGLPLNSLGNATRYKANYERCFQDKPLHTRLEHVNVPDLFPLPKDAMEPQMAVALGCIIKRPGAGTPLIEQDPAKGLVFRYDRPGRAPVEVSLGKDKTSACMILQQSPEDLVRLSRQIDDLVVELAEKGAAGNQIVIKQLQDHLKTIGLLDWETNVIELYLMRLQ